MVEHRPPCYLAIDQGTTSTRIVRVDNKGHATVLAAYRHQQFYPQPGWVEHNPRELLDNVRKCLDEGGQASALGLANQGESCLAWDARTLEPLSPVIVWQDNRTQGQVETLREQGAERQTQSRAGLPLDAYFSATKMRWLLDHVPAVSEAAKAGCLHLGTTDAFFLEHLTGRFETDITTASRTSLMNAATGEWDSVLCDIFGVSPEFLPRIRPCTSGFGTLDNGTPVSVSMVDQQASLYGHGCRQTGDTKITFGTGAFVLMVAGDRVPEQVPKGILPTSAWQKKDGSTYALEGGVYNASSAVDWAQRIGLFNAHDELADFSAAPAISRNLVFVPALSGLAAPIWDRTASGMWLGMDSSTGREDMCQSVLEGIALRVVQVVDAMCTGDKIKLGDVLSIDGGLTRSRYFCQFVADVLQRNVVTRSFDELTAFGCAALAAEVKTGQPLELKTEQWVYKPAISEATAQKWRDRFADAVSRTRNWRI